MSIQIQQIAGGHRRSLHGADNEFVDHAAALLSSFWRIIGRRMGDNDHTNRWSLLHQPNRGAIVEIPDHPAFCRGPMNGWRMRNAGQYLGRPPSPDPARWPSH